MTKIVFLAITLLLTSCSFAQHNVHAFLFCKTLDRKIGKSVQVNFFNVSEKLLTIANALKYGYKDHYLINNDYNIKKVDSVISNTPIDNDDLVFLYFSTHGGIARTDTSLFPRLDVPDSIIASFKEHMALLMKNPKFLITIIEACSGYIETTPQEDFVFRQGIGNEPVISTSPDAVANIEELFSVPCKIIITAGQPGKDTWGTRNGSMFTNSFLQALTYYINLPANKRDLVYWDNILEQAKQNTIQMTSTTKGPYYPVWQTSCNNPFGIIPQTIVDTSEGRIPAITFTITTRRIWWRFRRPYDAILHVTSDTNVYKIDSVTYYLDRSFNDSIVTVPNTGNDFYYKLELWGTFPVKARVYLSDGHTVDLYKNFNFGNRSSDLGAEDPTSIGLLSSKPKQSIKQTNVSR
jgi:hypothetical protein